MSTFRAKQLRVKQPGETPVLVVLAIVVVVVCALVIFGAINLPEAQNVASIAAN
ncbi:hypothetical protein [Humidisolicoccus flavus]|uniref:hypothetical protein n=1 Tax=Humidisolicoccus flavus TaxID=3111414 RepID=UPI0032545F8D